MIALFNEIFSAGYQPEDSAWWQLAYYANYISAFALLEGSVGAAHALSYCISDALGMCHSKANIASLALLSDYFECYSQNIFKFCDEYGIKYGISGDKSRNAESCHKIMLQARDRFNFLWKNTSDVFNNNLASEIYINKAIEALAR
ncbi:hypothetical protein [Martelella alba]|uniref:HEPN domain-containing protein n=1 Tax=Martelella alba TaxID=2590451 RepID=A0ABY2SGA0_9HYPH|nr:hypothetical protein [Martelella alba]TKI04113.1 hypothetical protein FCN80_19315 [Martelella alba]